MKKWFLLILFTYCSLLRGQEASIVKTVNGSSVAVTNPVWSIKLTEPISKQYQVQGRIKYDHVQGDSYLEMWSTFPNGQSYFTRTLAESGPMGKITGDSDWREFQLPFDSTGTSNSPIALSVNLVLKGSGTVYVETQKLVELSADKSPANPRVWFYGNTQHPWWTNKSIAWINFSLTVLVCVLDTALMYFGFRGVGIDVCINIFKMQAVLGLGLCGVAWLAFHQEQPFVVWYPPLLWGGLLVLLSPGFSWSIRKNIRAQELRRMQALDA